MIELPRAHDDTRPLEASSEASGVDKDLRRRATNVIPGGMFGHLDASQLPSGYPQFFARGDGCRVWDANGREYLDLMCSWGPIVLGHRHPRVEEAVRQQLARGECLDGPASVMVELAELMVATIEYADWALFCKNGTDATTWAVRIARAATGRKYVLLAEGAYHGIANWTGVTSDGFIPLEQSGTIFFEYNNRASLEAAFAEAENDVAAVVVCPIRHDVHRDLELPTEDFVKGLRQLCDARGAALIHDEIRCGLRLNHGGSWEPLGVAPDLGAWGKAMGNGYGISAVVGSNAFRDAARVIPATGSYWCAASPMAAATATIRELERSNAVQTMHDLGSRLQEGLRTQAQQWRLDVTVSGPPQLPFLTFREDRDERQAFLWAKACVDRGVYLHPFHNWFLSAAHTPETIDQILEVTNQAFEVVAAGQTDDGGGSPARD
jgi:glutamate-1-semialdehyde 2,1-aminomutase